MTRTAACRGPARQAERILAVATPFLPALRFYRQCGVAQGHSCARLLRVAARNARYRLKRTL